jgi:catechol 2,3-dioxygenase-like lactoylglutathione lyase family enzyme
MKRLHVHVTVDDIEKGISFYSTLFAQEASVVKNDYAKWMLEDPAVNFAISEKHGKVGLNHLGFQVDSDAELKEIEDRLREAELTGHKEDNKTVAMPKPTNIGLWIRQKFHGRIFALSILFQPLEIEAKCRFK